MLSTEPRKALPKARNMQELSSGITRKTRVELCEGTGISGVSISPALFGLRVRERGGGLVVEEEVEVDERVLSPEVPFVVFLVGGGAVPTPANENCEGAGVVERVVEGWEGWTAAAGTGWAVCDAVVESALSAPRTGDPLSFALTISCSPSKRLRSRSDSVAETSYWSSTNGFGG